MILVNHTAGLILVGFGSVARGVLPLILRHIAIDPARIVVLTANGEDGKVARQYGVSVAVARVTLENHRDLLLPLLTPGDLLVNLGLNVSSAALVEVCQDAGALYLDTALEPWPNVYRNGQLQLAQRTSHFLREALRGAIRGTGSPTALLAHGANPGLVSHFVKRALLTLATDILDQHANPRDQAEWAALAQALGVKVIHITERDTQVGTVPRAVGEFVNTWSPDGLIDEACQPAELGWGTHERNLPPGGLHPGDKTSVFLGRPGAATLMRSWTPCSGPYHGFLLSHVESLTIADFYTVREDNAARWRPTVQFVYRPCDETLASIMDLAGAGWSEPKQKRLLLPEIVKGGDEVGVLLMGHRRGTFWLGSRLSAAAARSLVPPTNATTLQVAAGVLGGLVWVLENPWAGLREPDEIDHQRVLDVARPYLGELTGVYCGWTPLDGRTALFSQHTDVDCPWQFRNFCVDNVLSLERS